MKKVMGSSFALALLAALVLTSCGALGQSKPQALPTVVLDAGGLAPTANAPFSAEAPAPGSVTASGVVQPAEVAQISSPVGGSVQTVDAAVGDEVQAGQVLVRLAGSEKLAAAVTAAKMELLAAQQALTDINENAEQARAQAQLRLANAKDAYDQAEKRRGWKDYRVGDDNQIDVARADLIVAQDALKKMEDAYGGYADTPEDNLTKAAALSALSAARKAHDKAQANLNYLLSLPDILEVQKADAALEVARTELDAAQREFDKLKDGPDPAALSLARARVENAQAQLTASQSALGELEIKAPFAGTVSAVRIHANEWALPGQSLLVLADLNHLRVETTDLSERDVPKVALGQPVTMLIKAMNQEVTGHVVEIAPLADTLGGDVVYKTTLDLDNIPVGLRSGMSVEVQFLPIQE